MLRGAEDLKKVCHRMIGDQDEVTKDGAFCWVEVECLGACVNAPMAQINADYYEDLTPESFARIINDLAAGKPVKPGPQIDRQNSAPSRGRRRSPTRRSTRPSRAYDPSEQGHG